MKEIIIINKYTDNVLTETLEEKAEVFSDDNGKYVFDEEGNPQSDKIYLNAGNTINFFYYVGKAIPFKDLIK